MRAYWKTACGVLLCGWLCLCCTAPAAAQGHNVDVALVADPDIPVNNLTLAEVRKVFRGERPYWNTNLAVVWPIGAPVGRARKGVYTIIYQMPESTILRIWIGQMVRLAAAT